MSKIKIANVHKAKSTPISLRPIHVRMLIELSPILKGNRSRIIQKLIENAHRDLVKK